MIKVSAGLVSGGSSPLGLWMAAFSLCLHMAFPLCWPPASSGVWSSPYKDISHIRSESHCWDPVSRYHSHGDLALYHRSLSGRGQGRVFSVW